jgi:hypothetical protein
MTCALPFRQLVSADMGMARLSGCLADYIIDTCLFDVKKKSPPKGALLLDVPGHFFC